MPFELLADFKPAKFDRKIDEVWSSIARGLASRLVELEPRIRFKIRNFPPEGTRTHTDKGTLFKTGIALSEEDVPDLLKERIKIPEEGEYWIHNYRCLDCINPQTNEPGLWVPHIRRKLHHNHNLKDLGITAKGIHQPWMVTHRMVIGDSERIRGMGDLLYSVAFTGPFTDSSAMKGYDVATVLPVKKGFNKEAQWKLMESINHLEDYVILDNNMASAVPVILELLSRMDKRLFDPLPDSSFTTIEEDPEFQQQLSRDRMARRVMGRLTGSGVKPANLKDAIKP